MIERGGRAGVNIHRLHPEQKKAAGRILATAFFDYPLIQWIFPNLRHRQRVLPWYLGITIRDCLEHGEVYTTSKLEGISAWLKPDNTGYLRRILRSGMLFSPLYLGLRAFQRAYTNSRHVESVRKSCGPDGPYWHLAAIGVLATAQGRGVGGALLQPVLAEADQYSLPCYLETHLGTNLRFYHKHGFEVVYKGSVGQVPLLWAMLRVPR